jgi:integrase
MSVKIEKDVLKDGSVRWRARGVSTGRDPATGKRTQRTITAKTKKEVQAEVARITGKVADGTYTPRWDGLVSEVIDDYLKSAAFEREANTRLSYTKALLPARERLGQRKARSITRQDVEQLRDWMLAEGRRRGGKPGTGLGPRSVQLTLGRLSAAFELACQDNRLAANPCRYVKLPGTPEREDTTWSEAQLQRFLTAAAGDRLWACWLLSALGLRRGEVLGLKWSDISFTEGTVTICRSRVLVDGKIIAKSPKSRRSWRVLPLFEPVTGVLEALYKAQLGEKAAAGPAYAGEVDDGYVAADELGVPLHPEHYSDEFARLCRQAGLPKIRLHDCRGTMNGILEQGGVADSFRAAWLGHTIAVNRKSYTPKPKELTVVSDLIGSLFKAGPSKV